MRYFLFASLCMLVFSCSRQTYREQEELQLTREFRAADFRPQFDKTLYRCVVNGRFGLKKFHLTGILYLKNYADTGTRVVFQAEMGATFFDFGWNRRDSFHVYSIMDQMNKPALVKTLRKDFELLLAKNLGTQPTGVYRFYRNAQINYIRFSMAKGFVHYLTDGHRRLTGIEHADERQKVVIIDFPATDLQHLPEKLSIRHLKAGFTIDLKKIIPDDTAE